MHAFNGTYRHNMSIHLVWKKSYHIFSLIRHLYTVHTSYTVCTVTRYKHWDILVARVPEQLKCIMSWSLSYESWCPQCIAVHTSEVVLLLVNQSLLPPNDSIRTLPWHGRSSKNISFSSEKKCIWWTTFKQCIEGAFDTFKLSLGSNPWHLRRYSNTIPSE